VTTVWSGDPGFKAWHQLEIFLFSKCSDWLWGSYSFLFNEYQGSFLETRQLGHEVDHSPLVLRLRMSSAIPPIHLYTFMAWTRTTIIPISTKLSHD